MARPGKGESISKNTRRGVTVSSLNFRQELPAGQRKLFLRFRLPVSKGVTRSLNVSFDGAGNLYSTVTYEGGGFRLKSDGQFGEIHVPSGLYPNGGVLVDSTQGKLYATAASNSGGNVYQFTASNQLTTIYAFCSLTDCDDGSAPEGDLIQDASGNIYGTTTYGGPYQQGDYGPNGVVFELSPQ